MNFALCSNSADANQLLQYTMQYFEKCHCYPKVEVFQDKEDLFFEMKKKSYDIILIAWTKAKGMEIVRQIVNKNKETNIIWISDDEDFVRFARDYNIRYFTVKHDRQIIEKALEACGVVQSENYYSGNIKARNTMC